MMRKNRVRSVPSPPCCLCGVSSRGIKAGRTLPVLVAAVLSLGLPPMLASAASTDATVSGPIRYTIVVTGGELLSGVYADGHTVFITRTLRPLGLQCVGSMSVDDQSADVKEALRFATGKAPLVIVTGGLGPTDNDITREAISDFTEIALEEDPNALREMARRFNRPAVALRANLRRQTRVPTSGTYLQNRHGTAVGLVFESAGRTIVALPGPPRELQPMVRDELVPYLSKRFGTRLPGSSLTLRFVGLGQSEIDVRLKQHVTLPPDVITSSQFEGGRVDFTFSLPDDTPKDRARLQALKKQIMQHLGEHIYADDQTSLEEKLVELLAARGETLALAEVAGGGTLTAALSSADGAHRVLTGAYMAPTMEKLRRLLRVPNEQWSGASDVQRLDLLAATTAGTAASQWTIVVGQAPPGPGGGRVRVTFLGPDRSCVHAQVSLRGTGETARRRLNTQLLDQLRWRLK